MSEEQKTDYIPALIKLIDIAAAQLDADARSRSSSITICDIKTGIDGGVDYGNRNCNRPASAPIDCDKCPFNNEDSLQEAKAQLLHIQHIQAIHDMIGSNTK